MVGKLFISARPRMSHNWPEPRRTGFGRWRPCSLYDQTASCDQTPIADLDLKPQSWPAHQSKNPSKWWASFWLLVSDVLLLLSQPCTTHDTNDAAFTLQSTQPRKRLRVNYHHFPSWRICGILAWVEVSQAFFADAQQISIQTECSSLNGWREVMESSPIHFSFITFKIYLKCA